MLEDSLQSDQLQKLTLPQIFQQEDLVMEEILGIKDIHQKIKRNMEIFTDYCREKHSFTERLIMLGLKCPMHQSNNQNMKNLTFIAADLLTSQHQSLADLFILPQSQKYKEKKQLQNGEEIEEFIETDVGLGQVQQQFDKYKFLRIIFDYIATEELDENCLNYITKALNILIRRKISQFLEYFSANQAILKQLIEISIFPSIAHFLAKLLADDEEKLSNAAFQTKRKIIPLILQKFHRDIGLSSTFQILECIEDVLNSTRYCDLQQRSSLQKLADLIVSGEEIAISLNQLLSSITSQHVQQKYFNQAINSASYLSVVINRMNMDEQQNFNLSEIQEFRPTQTYEINQLYSHFCAIIVVLKDFWQFKPKFQNFFWFALNKIVQPLVLMSKHSRFGYFYGKIDQKDRRSALEALIYMTCLCNLHGILLQSITTLLEKMLAEEEKMTESSNQIVNPGDLYSIVSEYGGSIGSIVNSLFQESTNQRNRNQNGIYFRKILLLLDNYFNHTAVLEKYPNIGSLQTIFPAFNKQNCQIFAQKAAILNHPDGERVKQITQFQFIKKNKSLVHCLQSQIDEFVQPKKQYIVQIKKQPITNPAQMKLKLGEKLKAIKERVKEKKANKGQENNLVKQNIQVTNLNAKSLAQPSSNSPLKQQQSNNNSDSTHNRNKRLFFLVKLLMIY